MRRLIRFPAWARYALLALGIAWLLVGWVGGGAFWISVIVAAAVWGVVAGRRVVQVTLEPWSKERGLVIWAYYRKQKPSVEPMLLWNDAPPTYTDSAAPPSTASPVTEAQPKEPPAPSAFPTHPPSAASAAPEDAAPQVAVVAPTPDYTEHRTCPDCAETVLAAARVCRYCGYRFEAAPAAD